MKRIIMLFLAVIICFICVACDFDETPAVGKLDLTPIPGLDFEEGNYEYEQISLIEMLDEYESNKSSAEEKYIEKYVCLLANVSFHKMNVVDNGTISEQSVMCFEKLHSDKARGYFAGLSVPVEGALTEKYGELKKELKSGDEVLIKGIIIAFDEYSVKYDDILYRTVHIILHDIEKNINSPTPESTADSY